MTHFAVNLFAACEDTEFPLYGMMIAIGTVLSLFICMKIAKQRGYYKDILFDMLICCLPLAILGARLYYVIFDVAAGNGADWSFGKFFGFENGTFTGLSGLAIYGGVIGIAIGLVICLLAIQSRKPKEQRASLLQMLDIAFAVFMLGQAFGRWGNFFNQEAYGNLVENANLQWFPYAVYIKKQSAWYQATFFYESMWNLMGAALLIWMYAGKRKSFDGFSVSMYCIFYGTGRIFIEGLRSDSLYMWAGGPRVSQVLSGILIAFGLIFILVHIYRARKHNKKVFIMVPEHKLNFEYLDYNKSMLYLRTLAPEPVIEEIEEAMDEEDKYWEKDEEGYLEEQSLTEAYFGQDSDTDAEPPKPESESEEDA